MGKKIAGIVAAGVAVLLVLALCLTVLLTYRDIFTQAVVVLLCVIIGILALYAIYLTSGRVIALVRYQEVAEESLSEENIEQMLTGELSREEIESGLKKSRRRKKPARRAAPPAKERVEKQDDAPLEAILPVQDEAQQQEKEKRIAAADTAALERARIKKAQKTTAKKAEKTTPPADEPVAQTAETGVEEVVPQTATEPAVDEKVVPAAETTAEDVAPQVAQLSDEEREKAIESLRRDAEEKARLDRGIDDIIAGTQRVAPQDTAASWQPSETSPVIPRRAVSTHSSGDIYRAAMESKKNRPADAPARPSAPRIETPKAPPADQKWDYKPAAAPSAWSADKPATGDSFKGAPIERGDAITRRPAVQRGDTGRVPGELLRQSVTPGDAAPQKRPASSMKRIDGPPKQPPVTPPRRVSERPMQRISSVNTSSVEEALSQATADVEKQQQRQSERGNKNGPFTDDK